MSNLLIPACAAACCGGQREATALVVSTPPPHRGGRHWVFVKLTTDDGLVGVGEVYKAPFHPLTVAKMIEDVGETYALGSDPFQIERLWRSVYYGDGYESHDHHQHPDHALTGVLSALEMGLLGHRRQGPEPTHLQPARRPSPRHTALLHLPLAGARRHQPPPHAYRPGRRGGERTRPCGRRLHGVEVRPAHRRDGQPRPARAASRPIGQRRSRSAHGARSSGQPSGYSHRHPRPIHHIRHHPLRPPHRAVRPALVRGAGAGGEPRRDGTGGATTIPVATGERLATKFEWFEFRELLEKQAAAILQMALGRVGGILEARKIAGMAEAYYAQIAPHLYCAPSRRRRTSKWAPAARTSSSKRASAASTASTPRYSRSRSSGRTATSSRRPSRALGWN